MLTSFLLMQYFGVFLSNLIGPLKFQEGEYLPKPCIVQFDLVCISLLNSQSNRTIFTDFGWRDLLFSNYDF